MPFVQPAIRRGWWDMRSLMNWAVGLDRIDEEFVLRARAHYDTFGLFDLEIFIELTVCGLNLSGDMPIVRDIASEDMTSHLNPVRRCQRIAEASFPLQSRRGIVLTIDSL